MKRSLLVSTLLLGLIGTSGFSDIILNEDKSVTFDITKKIQSSDSFQYMLLYKNGRFFKLVRDTSYTLSSKDYIDGDYKILAKVKSNGKNKYIQEKEIFSDVPYKVNEKPVLNFNFNITGMNGTFDLSNSTDDGSITKYVTYLFKDGKLKKVLNNDFNTYDFTEEGDYRILSYVMDDRGTKSSYFSKYFTVTKPVEPVQHDIDYTIGDTSIIEDSNIRDSEYIGLSYGTFHDKIGSWAAYEQGWTGEGVKVGIIDSGIDLDHPDLIDNIKYSVSLYNTTKTEFSSPNDDYGHGTKVAGIIAASHNGEGMHGVAYDADLYSIKVTSKYGSTWHKLIANGVAKADELDLKVANISLGGTTSNGMLEFKDTYLSAIQDDTSLVFSAGNEGTKCEIIDGALSGCNYPAVLPLYEPTLLDGDGAWIVVGSVHDDNTLTSYSNTAGVSKDFFMVAPEGGFTWTTSNDGSYSTSAFGTSFAAPMVTGAFALLAQKYPYLKGKDIQDILFVSADDLGEEGVDEIYGWGRLNIETAMAPIGTLNIPVGGTVNSSKIPSTVTNITIGGAISSQALTNMLSQVMVLDDYNRGFTTSINPTDNTIKYDSDDYSQITFNNNIILGLNEQMQTMSLGYKFNGIKTLFSVSDDVFGSSGSGATALNGNTFYGTVGFGDKLNLEITYGYSNANVGGMFKDISDIHGIGAKVSYNTNNLEIGIKSPVSVIKGKMDVSIPMYRDMNGNVATNNSTVSLIGDRNWSAYIKYSF